MDGKKHKSGLRGQKAVKNVSGSAELGGKKSGGKKSGGKSSKY